MKSALTTRAQLSGLDGGRLQAAFDLEAARLLAVFHAEAARRASYQPPAYEGAKMVGKIELTVTLQFDVKNEVVTLDYLVRTKALPKRVQGHVPMAANGGELLAFVEDEEPPLPFVGYDE